MSTETRNSVVVEMVDEIRGMAFNFARRYSLDFDDCLQDSVLIMLEVWQRIPDSCTDVKAYLHGTARRHLYNLLRRRRELTTLSLDGPVAEDSTQTFADMLQAFVHSQDAEREDFITAAVHAALKQCKLEEQLYARQRFELNSFNPVPPCWPCVPNYDRSDATLRASVKRKFSKNPQILELVH